MHKGKAEGGPLDGVLLSGPVTWDGRIRLPHSSGVKSTEAYYSGYYKWMYGVWKWRNEKHPRQQW